MKDLIRKILNESYIGITRLQKWTGLSLPNIEKNIDKLPINSKFGEDLGDSPKIENNILKYPIKTSKGFVYIPTPNETEINFTKSLDDSMNSGNFTSIRNSLNRIKANKKYQNLINTGKAEEVQAYFKNLEDRINEVENTFKKNKLKNNSISDMVTKDQEMRKSDIMDISIDLSNQKELKKMLGKDPNLFLRNLNDIKDLEGVWLIVQHADNDVTFQKMILKFLNDNVDQISKKFKIDQKQISNGISMLTDRIMVNSSTSVKGYRDLKNVGDFSNIKNGIQKYGTQGGEYEGNWVPRPIELNGKIYFYETPEKLYNDKDFLSKINSLRNDVGLPNLEDYVKLMQKYLPNKEEIKSNLKNSSIINTIEKGQKIKSKEKIDFAFKQHPNLSEIGTKEQYEEYLNTIFPNSVVKDIFYHRTPEDFDEFDKSKIKQNDTNRFYFSPINTGRYGKNIKLVVLDIKRLAEPYDESFIKNVNKEHPEYTDGKSKYFHLPTQIYVNADKYGYDGVYAYKGTNDDEISVYEPKQIHILGSENDIKGFKKFVENTQTSNLKESIKRILMEEKLPLTPQKLIKSLPKDLKELLFKQWNAKQNPEWHPEGNTLKHILVVLKRAYHHYPDDPNMIMTALFHDLGKSDTYSINPKTNQPTAYGHEYKSTDYVEQFRDWIESFEGTDVDEIKYLVRNHMKVKPSTWNQMRDIKKEPIKSNPLFDKLMGFTDKLDGRSTDLKESITRILKEETKPKYKIDKYKIDGFDVYVGKNSESNEYLTMEMSDDSDLWFHTKKYPGTHVILSLNGMEPTRESIIFCSKLAKENSKGSEKDNVEVVYCYIRDIFKTNDMRVGQVDVHPSKLKEIVV